MLLGALACFLVKVHDSGRKDEHVRGANDDLVLRYDREYPFRPVYPYSTTVPEVRS